MGSRFLTLAAIGLACIVAAAGGAYLAVWHAQTPAQPAQVATPGIDNEAPAGAKATPAGLVTTPPAASEIDTGAVSAKTAVAPPDDRRSSADTSATAAPSQRSANRPLASTPE